MESLNDECLRHPGMVSTWGNGWYSWEERQHHLGWKKIRTFCFVLFLFYYLCCLLQVKLYSLNEKV